MTTKQAAKGDRSVTITFEEFQKYVTRAFRAFRPQHVVLDTQHAWILSLSPRIKVAIHSSIYASGMSAPSGTQPIKVGFMFAKGTTPGAALAPLHGKESWAIVKRTDNWRDNLEDRVNDCIEKYESNRQDYKDTF